MKSISSIILAGLAMSSSVTASCSTPQNDTLPSTHMIQSIMSRKQGIISSGAATSTLESGILSLAMQAWLAQYPSSPMASNISSYLDDVLATIIASFHNVTSVSKLPLDRLSVGKALYDKSTSKDLTESEATALSTLNASLAIQERNPAGGFWYYVYPEWSYLDGAESFLPFMASMGWSAGDMLNQIVLLRDHCADNSSGLYVHGYDFNKTAVWANPVTGGSPYVWGRSVGWYAGGLVDAYEVLSSSSDRSGEKQALAGEIKAQMQGLATNLVKFADNSTGVWYQLPTFPGREGNFLESSSTALFVFSLLKAVRLGIAPASVVDVAKRAYLYTKETFVVPTGNGTIGYNQTVAVNSLNSTATYEYYTTRPFVPNSLLGEAAFVLASLEIERGI